MSMNDSTIAAPITGNGYAALIQAYVIFENSAAAQGA